MTYIGTLFLGIGLTLLSITTKSIEKAFFQGEPRLLLTQLSTINNISISLPDPISFSDQLSPDQTYFLFRNIFSSFSTLEFFPENEFLPQLEKKYVVFKSRWSFKEKRNNRLFFFQIFFYISYEPPAAIPKDINSRNIWKITEIRAEVQKAPNP